MNSALVSRCQVYVLKALGEAELVELLHQAISKDVDLQTKNIILKETTALINISGGDARKLLNLLELVADALGPDAAITDEAVMEIAQKRIALYDKKGEQPLRYHFCVYQIYPGQRPQCSRVLFGKND